MLHISRIYPTRPDGPQVRGNKRSHDVFTHAWKDYQANTKKEIRANPGKDQNKVGA